MYNLHPRRNAREGVLEALFAQEFSEEKPKVVENRYVLQVPKDQIKKVSKKDLQK